MICTSCNGTGRQGRMFCQGCKGEGILYKSELDRLHNLIGAEENQAAFLRKVNYNKVSLMRWANADAVPRLITCLLDSEARVICLQRENAILKHGDVKWIKIQSSERSSRPGQNKRRKKAFASHLWMMAAKLDLSGKRSKANDTTIFNEWVSVRKRYSTKKVLQEDFQHRRLQRARSEYKLIKIKKSKLSSSERSIICDLIKEQGEWN